MSAVTNTFNPKVSNPNMSINITQMRSSSSQAPFYFGGSQVPYNLGITKQPKMTGGRIRKQKFTTLDQAETKQLLALPHSLPFRK